MFSSKPFLKLTSTRSFGRFIVISVVLALFSGICRADDSSKVVDSHVSPLDFDAVVASIKYSESNYLSVLLQKSKQLNLSNHRIWNILGLYKKTFFGWQSQVDGQNFFLSKTGTTDRQAELDATLAAFFSTQPLANTSWTAQCRFPARYHWLKKMLNFDVSKLPQHPCTELETIRKTLDVDSLTVVFSSAHPNSPSSMLGHTLFRFDKRGQNKQTRMLAYSVNYAAIVDTANSFNYALKGLTGGFQGRFSIIPYYMKLREYAQMENRDIWEYKLKLDQNQIDLILLRTFELSFTHFDYYFFTENCSYHLLSLLEIAFPELSLTEEFSGWVIPIDTLRLLEKYKLIDEVIYQPSDRTIIKHKRALMPDADRKLAISVVKNGIIANKATLDELPTKRQVAILDLSFDYQRYNKLKNSTSLDTKLNKTERQLLSARSKFKTKSPVLDIPTPQDRPDRSHKTYRLSFGDGYINNQNYVTLGFRGAYHALLDPTQGYSPYSQIEFLKLSGRYFTHDSKVELEKFTLLDILSLQPRDAFFNHISWRFNTGVYPKYNDNKNYYGYALDGGAGVTYNVTDNSFWYAFVESKAEINRVYEKNYWLAFGLSTGVLLPITQRWNHHISFKIMQGVAHDRSSELLLTYQTGISIANNLALHFGYEWTRTKFVRHPNTFGRLNFYF